MNAKTLTAPKGRPAIFGIWLHQDRDWLLLGLDDSADVDMPHTFFSKRDATNWLEKNPAFSDTTVLPLNREAGHEGDRPTAERATEEILAACAVPTSNPHYTTVVRDRVRRLLGSLLPEKP